MAALYLERALVPGRRAGRQERAEEVAQAGIGTINALAALGVEQGLVPEHLTDLAMAVLLPGIAAMAGD